jgi:hypothetical protein
VTSRWLWWLPLGLLGLSLALIGLRWGWIAATITETDVIGRYAAHYVASEGEGAEMSDCVGIPGHDLPGIWIVVRCRPNAGRDSAGRDYFVNRLGGFEYGESPQPARWEPQT